MQTPTFFDPFSDDNEWDNHKTAERRQLVRQGLTRACQALVLGNHITMDSPILETESFTTVSDRQGRQLKRSFLITIELVSEEELDSDN